VSASATNDPAGPARASTPGAPLPRPGGSVALVAAEIEEQGTGEGQPPADTAATLIELEVAGWVVARARIFRS
jgi:hypothetical protein